MSTDTTIPDEVVAAKLRFDAACLDWGWQADQGYDGNAISSSYLEYRAAHDALSAAIAKAIHDAVMAEREKHAWHPIATAPRDGTAIIARTTAEEVFACNWFDDEEEPSGGYWLVYGVDEVRPREWIPMPVSLKAEGK